MDWKTRIGLWWFDYVHFPLWHRFGSKKSHDDINEDFAENDIDAINILRGIIDHLPSQKKQNAGFRGRRISQAVRWRVPLICLTSQGQAGLGGGNCK